MTSGASLLPGLAPRARPTTVTPQQVSRAAAIFAAQLDLLQRRRDRGFAWLMGVQWVFGVALALLYSPYAWVGKVHTTHLHVEYALFVGAALSLPTIALGVWRPGWRVTRYTVAVAQMGWSALFIHLTGGRIESHFHAFGSLAYLAFYRDGRVLCVATAVAIGDHLLRGLTWPEAVYGINHPEQWRLLEHSFWLLSEAAVLLVGVRETRREMRALARREAEAETLRATIERRVEERTEELAASRELYRALVEGTRSVVWQWDLELARFSYVGPQVAGLLGCEPHEVLEAGFLWRCLHPDDAALVADRIARAADLELRRRDFECRLRHADGTWRTVRVVTSDEPVSGVVRGILLDVTEHKRLELELQHAQKLESVGRLASGVAHEINTPIQFVNDSLHFVRDGFADALALLAGYRELRLAVRDGATGTATGSETGTQAVATLARELERAEHDADLDYLVEHVPKALERSLDGLARVATLVRSMKEFAHPDRTEKAAADLNHALTTTLTIARNEYKYCADVATDFGDLPPVMCHLSELNQVFLNVIVNASHAIGDVVGTSGARGLIRVSTRREGDQVVVRIADSGGGIPLEIQDKIFEPFFTTKEVGRGTGQGLSIARSVVVNKHGGTLTFESEVGRGTTFIIKLPIAADGAAPRKDP